MNRIPFIIIGLFSVVIAPAQTGSRTGSLRDTVQIDVLLDSAKAWVATGETERPVVAAGKALALLDDMPVQGPSRHALLLRAMQAHKLQGMAHHYAGRYAKALEQFIGMERMADSLGRPRDAAAALSYQGYEYRSTDDLERARSVTWKALNLLHGFPPDRNLAITTSALGSIYLDLDRIDSGIVLLGQAVTQFKILGQDVLEASCRTELAQAQLTLGRVEEALNQLQLARNATMEGGTDQDKAVFLYHEARALWVHGELDRALRSAEEGLALARTKGNAEDVGREQEILALILSAKGRPREAAFLQDSSRTGLLENLNLEKTRAVTEVRLNAEHAQERQQTEVKLALGMQRERNALVFGAMAVLIAVLLAGLLISTRRKNARILRAQQQVIEAEKQRETEQVRTRLARDIHDDIGSGLTKIALLGNEAKRRIQESSAELSSTLDRIIGHSREVSAALSDIVWTVDPLRDNSEELVTHAQNLARRMLDHSAVAHEFHFRHEEPLFNVAPGTKHHIVMVMKEAINNALKYADAKHISVELKAGAQHFSLQVKDDGKGFDPAAMAATGNGLRNMRARAEAIGATLTMESAPGLGCTVRMEGPLT